MDHIGIDVHKRESQIYILAQGGKIVEQRGTARTARASAVTASARSHSTSRTLRRLRRARRSSANAR